MSGIVSGIDYSILFPSGTSSAQDASTAILNALYGGASGTTPPSNFVSTGNPLTDLKLAQKDQTADVAKEAKLPQVSQAIAAFNTAVSHAANIQDALANPDVQKVLLTANGLSNY